MRHLKPINQKADRVNEHVAQQKQDVVALQTPQQPVRPHLPMGCTFLFSPGWEADQAGGTAGLCTPVERDIFDCHISCFWPASARRPRKTGGTSTSCFHDRERGFDFVA
jgi:Quinohemoprotein amine dehydrogenase, gamma subunit